MLREYQLTNFKAFGETVTIPIRPLTLIFGANSSGKSSIFQSLLLLKQTLEEAKSPATALLPKGSLVDLGTYSDFVHRHDASLSFEVEMCFALDVPLTVSPHERELRGAGLSVGFYYDDDHRMADSHGNLTVGDNGQPIASYHVFSEDLPARIEAENSEFWDSWRKGIDSYEDFDFLIRTNFSDSTLSQIFSLHEVLSQSPIWRAKMDMMMKERESISFEEIYSVRDFFPDIDHRQLFDLADYVGQNFLPRSYNHASFPLELRELPYYELFKRWMTLPVERILSSFRANLESLLYLGPFRSQPERYETYSNDATDYVGKKGEHLTSILIKRPELVSLVDGALEKMRVKYRLKPEELQHKDGSPTGLCSLRLVQTDTGIETNIRDVGFGISQVLPVVLQSRLSEKKTLLIEQPEIHLHPAHQAELGDLFIRSAKEQGNTLLLETHSENLILRILRRIRQTASEDSALPEGCEIHPEDVAVLYVQPGEKGAQVIEIPVTEDGDFDRPWPQGFFEESIKELV